MIVKNEDNDLETGEILGIVDLKIDLGYLNDEYYEIEKKVEDNRIKTFNQRENNFNDAYEIRCNTVVNSNSEKKKSIGNNKKIYLKKSANISKLAIVATSNNDHNRAEKYKKIMELNGYECHFILDNKHHPNHNTDTDFTHLIEKGLESIKFIFHFDR